MNINTPERFLLLASALFALSSPLRAQTFAETGDAGQTLATSQNTNLTAGTTLLSITGTIGTAADADLFRLTISNTTTFSATASSSSGIDTSLFLFDSSGAPIIANDDQSNTSFQARIPSGSPFLMTLAPGTYYIGISLSGNEPVNSANQLLFTVDQPTTNVRGPASGLNPVTLATFNGGTFVSETGSYAITFAVVPEPSTWALAAIGLAFLGCFTLRRRLKFTA